MAKKKTSAWCKAVKIAMIQQDITVKELAEKLNFRREYVSAIINGRVYAPNAVSLICDILDIEDNFQFKK
jgi:plasmid maintenance system antidote protein VapI